MQGLSTTQANALTSAQLGGLATATFEAFHVDAAGGAEFDPGAWADDDAAERGFDDFAGRADGFQPVDGAGFLGLSPTTLNNLTNTQVTALTSTQTQALSTTQLNALSSTAIDALNW